MCSCKKLHQLEDAQVQRSWMSAVRSKEQQAVAVSIQITSSRQAAAASGLTRFCLQSASQGCCQHKRKEVEGYSLTAWVSKFSRKAENYMEGIKDHVSLSPKISDTLKGKFNLGARILQPGGLERVFRQNFSGEKGEKLIKTFQCYLSTTAGPIAGLLFISSTKIAFRSDQPVRITSPKGNIARVPYKVLIPVGRVRRASMCENSEKRNQKYIQILTVDDFDFWFMGFLSCHRSLKHLRRAIAEADIGAVQ